MPMYAYVCVRMNNVHIQIQFTYACVCVCVSEPVAVGVFGQFGKQKPPNEAKQGLPRGSVPVKRP